MQMPLYLIRFGYTPEEWAKTIKQPEDRRATIGPLLEATGDKLHGLWYAFGDHDGYALAEAPDNTAAASTLLTLTGSGKFRAELVATDEWARCVMACRFGWMAIACGAGGQVTRDRRLAGAGRLLSVRSRGVISAAPAPTGPERAYGKEKVYGSIP